MFSSSPVSKMRLCLRCQVVLSASPVSTRRLQRYLGSARNSRGVGASCSRNWLKKALPGVGLTTATGRVCLASSVGASLLLSVEPMWLLIAGPSSSSMGVQLGTSVNTPSWETFGVLAARVDTGNTASRDTVQYRIPAAVLDRPLFSTGILAPCAAHFAYEWFCPTCSSAKWWYSSLVFSVIRVNLILTQQILEISVVCCW